MAGYVILGMLSAYGLLSALWAAFGWLLPGLRGCALVCVGVPEEGTLNTVRWLKGLGLLTCPLLVVAEEGEPDLEICSREDLVSRLEMERKRFDGTGNGDHSGHHQRGGVPEL